MSAAKWTGNGASTPLTNEEQISIGLGTRKRSYIYRNEPHNRLTLEYNGVLYRPHDNLIHDYGSIPQILQGIPVLSRWFSKDSYPKSTVLHDAGYDDMVKEREHTLWISRDGGIIWNLEKVSRDLMDELLRVGVIAEGGPRWVSETYYRVVRACGWLCW